MKVLFLNPPSIPYTYLSQALSDRNLPFSQPVSMPMGILYLAAVLQEQVPDVEIRIFDFARLVRSYSKDENRQDFTIDQYFEYELEQQAADGFEPDFIGISTLFSTAHRTTIHLAKAAKKRWSEAPIVVGGMHSTNAVEALLASPNIDYVCRGEAESIIVDLVKVLSDKGDGESIQGIIGHKKLAVSESGKHSNFESAPLVEDLDMIPFPAWNLIPMEEYVHTERSRARRLDSIVQHKEATIMTTRGCPFRCTFCASWTVHGRAMRYRSTQNVIDELDILYNKYGVRVVVPEDDLFTVKKPRIIELCEAIADKFEQKLEFQFPNGLSVATLDEDVIHSMMKMGMDLVNVAIESGSDYVQKHIIKKNCNLKRAVKVVKGFRDAGAYVRTYFILGFPNETREQMDETVKFASDLPADWCNFGIAAPLIGTEMYDQLLELGNIDENFNWDTSFYQERSYDTPEITALDLKELTSVANLRVNFFGNYNVRHGEYERAIILYKEICSSYPDHLAGLYCIALCYQKLNKHEEYKKWMLKCHDVLKSPDNNMPLLHLKLIPDQFPEEFLKYSKEAKPTEPRLLSYWVPDGLVANVNAD